MRKCLLGDILAAATVVAAAPGDAAHSLAARLIAEADAAHRYAKRFDRPHPLWGNGSLMARALAEPPRRRPGCNDPGFLTALAAVATALSLRQSRC